MASIHKQPGKPYYFCAFSIWNPETLKFRRVFRSTKTKDKKQALEICRAWHRAALKARTGKLNEDSARAIIAQGVSDMLLATTAEALPSASIESWCESWLRAKTVETTESTVNSYRTALRRFIDFLGPSKAKRDLATLQASDVAQFRDDEVSELSRSTANFKLSVLRICLGEAVRQGLLTNNPATRVKLLKSTAESKRRAFTLDEIKRILKACGDDTEWRGLVLFGLYLGQRLGDLAHLTWRAVDLETGEVTFTTKKTGRRIVLPLVQPLADYLSSLPAGDNPDAFIFPHSAGIKHVASLSNQFREILTEAGLIEPPREPRVGRGKGLTGAREISEVSFHSLRHSAVTMLKAAGVSDFMAREIVGHGSAAVSRQYTHLTTDDKRNAMARVQDVTKS
jgi:integrase